MTKIEMYYWDKFHDDNIKNQLEEKGEAYLEWTISKSSLVKQLNYLRSKYKLKIVHFPKESNPDCICIFIKPKQ
jgi:hypothetical protein